MAKKGPDFSRPPIDDEPDDAIVVRRPAAAATDVRAKDFIAGAQQPLPGSPSLRVVGGSSAASDKPETDADKTVQDKKTTDRASTDKTRQGLPFTDKIIGYRTAPEQTGQDRQDAHSPSADMASAKHVTAYKTAVDTSTTDNFDADAAITYSAGADNSDQDADLQHRTLPVTAKADNGSAGKTEAHITAPDKPDAAKTDADTPVADKMNAVDARSNKGRQNRGGRAGQGRDALRADGGRADNKDTDKPSADTQGRSVGFSLSDWVGEAALQSQRRAAPEPTGKAHTIKVPGPIMGLLDEIHAHRGRSRSHVIVSILRDALGSMLADHDAGRKIELPPVRLAGQDRRSVSVTIPFDVDADIDKLVKIIDMERHQLMMRILIPGAILIWQNEIQKPKG